MDEDRTEELLNTLARRRAVDAEDSIKDELLNALARRHSEAKHPPTINDSRVVSAFGGGIMPEQHFGTLTNGDRFYLRNRHGYARLHVASAALCEEHGSESWISGNRTKFPPLNRKDWSLDEASTHEGRDLIAEEELPDSDFGAYGSREARDASFRRLMDQIEAQDQAIKHQS